MGKYKRTSRLQRFIGNGAMQRKSITCNFLVPAEEHAKRLSEYAEAVQKAVGNPKSKK